MLSFHPLTLEDKNFIDELTRLENSRSADFVFGNMFLWDGKYRQSVCRFENRLMVRVDGEHVPVFPFPVGSGDIKAAVEALLEYSRAEGFPFSMRGVEKHHMEALEELFPGHFTFVHDRDYDDYIYPAEKLSSLSGKKLHGKRNHINRFEALYPDHRFEALRPEHFPLCLQLLSDWSAGEGEHLVDDEGEAIALALENFDALGLMGGILFVNGEAAAFTIGEPISSDTFNVHFEKARGDIEGAYPMINREFVRHIMRELPHISYVNREDDMGLDNLRKSKLSYRPEIILEKYSAHWSD